MLLAEADFKVSEDKYWVDGATSRIARADVARFMLKISEDGSHKKKTVAIGF
jgi:putative NADH-flavin reductase